MERLDKNESPIFVLLATVSIFYLLPYDHSRSRNMGNKIQKKKKKKRKGEKDKKRQEHMFVKSNVCKYDDQLTYIHTWGTENILY